MADVKKCDRSTVFTDYKEAMECAVTLEKARKQGDDSIILLMRGQCRIKHYVDDAQ